MIFSKNVHIARDENIYFRQNVHKNYVKNNPKRFAKGLAKGTVGTGLGIAGAAMIGKTIRKKKDEA